MRPVPKNAKWDDVYSAAIHTSLPWERETTHNGKVSILRVLLRHDPGMRGLEVGCGRGHNLHRLIARGFEMHGIDIAESAVKQARIPTVCVADTLDLPYARASFDFVLDVGCFQHVRRKSRPRYVSEVRRALRPGGLLGLSCFSLADFYATPRRWCLSKYGLYINYSGAEELRALFAGGFHVLYLRQTSWSSSIGRPHQAWNLLARTTLTA